ncbi:MAG TPA: glycosyltransferase [Candidatus Binataceae bacterium]|nr:glycosyltransferase [Candidatus Binataceae bacterium]
MSEITYPSTIRVSVIIPVRNGADTVARAINCALTQDYEGGIEVVVANDGSTDRTAEILSRYGDRITVVTLEPSGVSAARNAAVNAARGEYIAFLDADDEWTPNKLTRTVPVLDEQPDCVLVFHDATAVDITGKVCSEWVVPASQPREPTLAQVLARLVIPTSCTVMRREIYQRCGGCREDLPRAQDHFLFMMAREYGRFCFVPEVLGSYRFVLTLSKEQRWLDAAETFDRLVFERFGIVGVEFSSFICLGLVHMARGDRALARDRFLRAWRLRPFEPKTYLRLGWTCLPSGLSRALGAVMPERVARALNGPPDGLWRCIAL